MTEVGSEINIEIIRLLAIKARQQRKGDDEQMEKKLLEKVLETISRHTIRDWSSDTSTCLHDIHDNKIYPGINMQNVIDNLKDRGFEAYIGMAHPAFPSCDCSSGEKPCMEWLKVKNTWYVRDVNKVNVTEKRTSV